VVKVSAGATEFLDIVRDRNANKYAQIALDAGYNIVVLDAKGDIAVGSLAADDLAPLFLVIGGEDRPVGQYIINNAYRVARIEQHGRINSLNASVAASIAMFALAQ
jgi:23S rRNA (guanosine2251-2'-O)-methyltransferase